MRQVFTRYQPDNLLFTPFGLRFKAWMNLAISFAAGGKVVEQSSIVSPAPMSDVYQRSQEVWESQRTTFEEQRLAFKAEENADDV